MKEINAMCGGVYEEDFEDAPRKDSKVSKEEKHRNMGSVEGGVNDLEFITAEQFMRYQDPYIYPGSDPQQ